MGAELGAPEDSQAEQSGESSVDYDALYKAEHPDAEMDPARAEAMAYASDESEVKMDGLLKSALGQAEGTADSARNATEQERIARAIPDLIAADSARVQANREAEAAGLAFDQEAAATPHEASPEVESKQD